MTYIALISSALLAIIARVFIIDVYKAPSHSMAPAILKGEHILSLQIAYGYYSDITEMTYFKSDPEAGELVVFKKNRKTFIKRVVAVPGQTIQFKNGVLSVDSDTCLTKDYAQSLNSTEYIYKIESCKKASDRLIVAPLDSKKNAPPIEQTKLAEDQFLVLSDNRSEDPANTVWDFIRSDQIVGKPFIIWLSYSSTQDFISESKGFRWNRFLTKVN